MFFMEKEVKRYFIKLILMALAAGILSAIFIHLWLGVGVFIVLSIISLIYINAKKNDAEFIKNISSSQGRAETTRKVGGYGLKLFLIFLLVALVALAYANIDGFKTLNTYSVVLGSLIVIVFLLLVYLFLKNKKRE